MERKRKKLNNDNNFKKIIILLIILAVAIFFFPKIMSLSKYVLKAIQSYYLASKEFYFNSDKLTKTMQEREITNNWSGLQSYEITVNLNSKKNDMVCAPNDITYNISYTCSSNISCTLSKTSGTIIGTNNNGTNEDSFTVMVNPIVTLYNGNSVWVELTATSSSPYVETLQGKLIITVGTEKLAYEIADVANSPYLQLDLTNTLISNINVTLSFNPTIVLLDMTSEYYLNSISTGTTTINGYTYVNSLTFGMDALSSTTIKFYKVDKTQDYTYSEGSRHNTNYNCYIYRIIIQTEVII